jgi:hypothetical protein
MLFSHVLYLNVNLLVCIAFSIFKVHVRQKEQMDQYIGLVVRVEACYYPMGRNHMVKKKGCWKVGET